MRAVLLAALLLAPAASARWIPFDAFRFQPVDEAERDGDFHGFRVKLSRVVEERDEKSLPAFLSEGVLSSLTEKSKRGKAAFLHEWRLDNNRARESELWDALRDTLRLGGSFEDGDFLAPYVYSRWPERFPHLDYYAVTTKTAAVHKEANENSRVIETLRQEIVGRFDELPNPKGWRAVRTSTGLTGYVRAEDTRSPLGWRAVFRKEKGEWKLRLFASGDWEAHERLE